MNQNQNTPELRFEGFTEPWKQQKLGDVAEIVGGGTPDTSNPDYWDGSIDWYSPVELGDQIYADRSVRRITDEGYANCSAKMLPAGRTILFTSRAGIGNTAILRRPACTNQGFQSIVIHDDVDVYFLYTQSTQMKQWAEKKASGSTFLEISGKQLAEMPLRFPRFEEQEKIGIYFQHLDSFIALQQRKYERLQHLKQALLRKMFPKPGEQVPELRFDGFTEPWEERKLGELYVRAGSGGTPSSGDPRYYGGHIPFLGIADMDGRFITKTEKSLTDDGLSNSAAWIVPAGSISLAMYASVGKVGITCCDMATSQAFYNMVFDSTVTRDFVYSRLDRADCLSEWRSLISTGTQSNLNAQKVRDWAVAMPSLPEQHAIGSLFRELDDFITLQQRKYERLQHLKQALLRKMFV